MARLIDAKVDLTVPLAILGAFFGGSILYGVHKMDAKQIEGVSHHALDTAEAFATPKVCVPPQISETSLSEGVDVMSGDQSSEW